MSTRPYLHGPGPVREAHDRHTFDVSRLDGSTWTLVWTSATTITDPDQFVELDLTTIITEPGSWRIRWPASRPDP